LWRILSCTSAAHWHAAAAFAAAVQVVIAMLVGQLQLQLHPSVGGWEGLLQRRMYHTTLQVEGGLPVLLRPRVTQ
jgi:hypothetical protein